jgi:hypothetical protein
MCNRIVYFGLVTILLAVIVGIFGLVFVQQWRNGYLQERPLSALYAGGLFVILIAALVRQYYFRKMKE